MFQKKLISYSSFVPLFNRYFLVEILNKHSTSDYQYSLLKSSKSLISYLDHNDPNTTWRNEILSKSSPLRCLKNKSTNEKKFEFVDYKHVNFRGGKGGDGMICFLQLWSNPKAGPSGGDGGNGGHIILKASKHIKSLSKIKSTYIGLPGENGMHKDMTGKSAEHLIIPVPIGTIVKNAQSKEIVADLYCDEMKFLAAKGGAGGKGNHYFLSNKNRHPYVAEIGAQGENNFWILEMKIIAHAGLIGFPNVGKSTLLSALSRANPKIASYPFTTLNPSVGIVQYEDGEQLAIADLPGIIEGAHRNQGLGVNFLKHVERCICFFFVIDISDQDPFMQLKILMEELRAYNCDLLKRPTTILANKVDIDGSTEKLRIFKDKLEKENLSHFKMISISGKYGVNLTELLVHFRELYDIHHLNEDNNL